MHTTGLPLLWLSCGCLRLAGHCSSCKGGMLCKEAGGLPEKLCVWAGWSVLVYKEAILGSR